MLVRGTEYEYGISETISPRYWLYYGAYKIVKNKPLLGEGPGKYGSFVSILAKSETYNKYDIIVDDKFKMDTFWATILGEYGILGFTTYIVLLLFLFRTFFKEYKKYDRGPFLRGLYIGYIILFVDYLVESIAQQVYSGSLYAFMLFAGMGLLISTQNGE